MKPATAQALVAFVALVVLSLLPTASLAARPPAAAVEVTEPEPNAISVSLGGQAAIEAYNSFLKVGVGYERWLRHRLWLDVGLTALVHADTNVGFLGGVRWWFGRAPGACPFVRVFMETAVLHDREKGDAVAFTPRGGGGIGYFASTGFGLTVEANAGLGIAVGDGGAAFAAVIDVLVGGEFRF